jgi:two-component system response regulator
MPRDDAYILLVEDSQDDIELTRRALKKHNLVNELKVMMDGTEALAFLFKEGPYEHSEHAMPQLVMLDINLPKLSGIEVLKRLRSDERTRLLPIVMLTSSKEERDVVQSYSFGANSYVQKPVSFEAFTEAVKQLGVYWLALNESPMNHHGT